MGIFDFFKRADIDQGVEDCWSTSGSVLLDVRTREEYAQGRVPHSRNLPLQEIGRADEEIPDRGTPLFVYCLSGARSRQAAAVLQSMGFDNITNIGGISEYRGVMEG